MHHENKVLDGGLTVFSWSSYDTNINVVKKKKLGALF